MRAVKLRRNERSRRKIFPAGGLQTLRLARLCIIKRDVSVFFSSLKMVYLLGSLIDNMIINEILVFGICASMKNLLKEK